ncbi:MAG: hypothetical protein II951_01270 [Bacteroidales bacterium]|nr:hypothetical protein [Bacteroidales bacterium]
MLKEKIKADDRLRLLVRMATVFVLVMLSCVVSRGADVYPLRHISVSDGLSDRHIVSVFRDHVGFLWIGTPVGLDRYDGYRAISFSSDTALAIGAVDEFKAHVIEYGPDTLISKIQEVFIVADKRTGQWDFGQKYFNSLGVTDTVRLVAVDDEGNLWMATRNRCFVYERGHHTIEVLLPKDNGRVSQICRTDGGVLVLMERRRVVRCSSPYKGRINTPVAYSSPLKNGAKKIFSDSDGDLWAITSYGDSLWYCPQTSKKWKLFDAKAMLGEENARLRLTDITQDNDRNMWVSSALHGIFILEISDGKSHNLRADDSDPLGLRSNKVECLYADNDGSIWIGYHDDGLGLYNKSAFKFNVVTDLHRKKVASNGAMTIALDRDKHIWMASETGTEIELYDEKTGQVDGRIDIWDMRPERYKQGYRQGYKDDISIVSMVCASDGVMWVAQSDGCITIVDPDRKNSTTIKEDVEWQHGVRPLAQDVSGPIWIVAGDEVLMRDHLTGQLISSFKLPDDNVLSIESMREGGQIVTSPRGAWHLDFSNGSLRTTKMRGDRNNLQKFISCVKEDDRGLLWFGSRDGIDIEKRVGKELLQSVDHINLDGMVTSMANDGQDDMIVTTSHGVFHVVVRVSDEGDLDFQLRRFTEADGLLTGEFGIGAALRSIDGTVVLGNTHGLNRFLPHSIRYKFKMPKVVFCAVDENGLGHFDMADDMFPYTKEVRIPYSHNSMMVKFSALEYVSLSRVNYHYQIIGKTPVVHLGTRPYLHLSCLSPGTYTLRVWVSVGDGAISGVHSDLIIKILPPIWQKKVFVFAMCLLALLVLLFVMIQVAKIRKKQIRRLEIRMDCEHAIRASFGNVIARQASSTKGDMKMIENLFGKQKKENTANIDIVDYVRSVCVLFENKTINNVTISYRPDESKLIAGVKLSELADVLIAALLHAYSTVGENGEVEVTLGYSEEEWNVVVIRVISKSMEKGKEPSKIGVGVATEAAEQAGMKIRFDTSKKGDSVVTIEMHVDLVKDVV